MKVKKSNLCIYLVLLWGIVLQLVPTSESATDVSFSSFSMLFRIAVLTVLIYLLGTRKVQYKVVLCQVVNIAFMTGYTVYSLKSRGFTEAYYNTYLYIILMLVLCMNIKNCTLPKFGEFMFYTLGIIMCILGLLIVFGNDAMGGFITQNYNRYWEKCTYYMVLAGKPVGSYATHSIAGFMYFQFLTMLYFKNQHKKNWLNMILMGVFVFLIAMLRSNTAILFLGLGAVLILYKDKTKMTVRSFMLKTAFIIAICVVLCLNMDWIQSITGSKENGFLGRFTGTSAFLLNFKFLKENLIPIGFTSSSSLWLSDCGYIIALLRGGILNMAVMYGSVYLFFKKNIIDKRMMYPFLISLFAFEIGYPILMELKYVMMLPFIVVFLNSLSTEAKMKDLHEKGYINESSGWNCSI